VHEWGAPGAPAVVCLHGVFGHGRRFRKLAEERLASRFRVIAPDLRGHGRSEWEPPWTLEAHLDDLFETLRRLGVEPKLWLGHSFGGRLVIEATARGLVERAALLEPVVWVPPPLALEHAEHARGDESFADIDDAIARRIDASALAHTPRELLDEEMAEHLVRGEDGRLRYRVCRSAVVTAFSEMARQAPLFEALRVPTLLVRGTESEDVPDVIVDVYRDGIGELLEVVDVPGGHTVFWDAFTETADAVDAFLVS
jgi:lipase